MAACPRCGYGNPDAVEFCENPDCRADLRPVAVEARPRSGGPPPVPTAPRPSAGATAHPTAPPLPGSRPPADRPPVDRKGVRLTAEPLELRVEPGGPPASTTVTVRNRGTRVEHFRLVVNGPVAPFAEVHPPELQVYPDKTEVAEVRFAVPRAPHPVAGEHPFQIVARARVDADVTDRVAGSLSVGRFDDMAVSLEPEMTRGRRPGHHRLTVTNRGNAPLDVRVAMTDQQGELSFAPPRFGGPLEPGASATEQVVVSAPLTWFGRTQVHPFTGTVTTDVRGQTALAQGRRRQVPRFPWWVPTAALALVALAIALYTVLPGAEVPPVAGLDRVAATTQLEEAGLRVVPIPRPDPAVPVNQTLSTVPEAGQPYERGQVAQLFYSVGPCGENCLIPVPVVDGLQTEEARSALAAAGLVVERVNPVPDPRAAGTVVRTNPPGGQEVAANSPVVIEAALGPETGPPTEGAEPSVPPTAGPVTGTAGPVPVPGPDGGAGAATVVVPELVGRPAQDAAAQLADLGLEVERTESRSNRGALDEVLGTTPPAGEQVEPGSVVTVDVAVPTQVDLIETAPTAEWFDETGALTFGPATPGSGAAFLHPDTTALENGVPAAALAMEPGLAGRVTGMFTLDEPVIAGDRVRALVGVLPDAGGTVEFSVTADGILLTPTISDTSADGALKLLDVDLGPVVGATALQVSVRAASGSNDNRAFLKDLRIEGLIG